MSFIVSPVFVFRENFVIRVSESRIVVLALCATALTKPEFPSPGLKFKLDDLIKFKFETQDDH